MGKLGIIALLLGTASVTDAAFQGSGQSQRPDDQFKSLFPLAGAFSAWEGIPRRVTAYAVDARPDPAAKPMGFIFLTTDLVPEERGYHGPIEFLIGMDAAGLLSGVLLRFEQEPYGFFSVQPPEFTAQFKGKSIRDPFRVGDDIAAISGASITIGSATRAIRDSARAVARVVLTPDAVKPVKGGRSF